MDPLFFGAIVASIVVVVLMMVFVSRIGRTRDRSAERAAALRALVAELSEAALPAETSQSPSPEAWDADLHENTHVETLPAPAAPKAIRPHASSRAAAPASDLTEPAQAHPFVVTVGSAGAGRYQVSFKRAGQ